MANFFDSPCTNLCAICTGTNLQEGFHPYVVHLTTQYGIRGTYRIRLEDSMRVEVETEQAAYVQASTKKLDYCTRQLDCIYKHRWDPIRPTPMWNGRHTSANRQDAADAANSSRIIHAFEQSRTPIQNNCSRNYRLQVNYSRPTCHYPEHAI